jgi:hypothetical protein
MGEDLEAGYLGRRRGHALGVDRDHDALTAEALRRLVHELRAGDRGGS